MKKTKIDFFDELLKVGKGDRCDVRLDQIQSYDGHPRKLVEPHFLKKIVDTIRANNGQPLIPVMLRRLEVPVNGCLYEIIDGEVRCIACRELGTISIQADVFAVNDYQQYMMCVVANLQRKTLTAKEIALSIAGFAKMKMSQRQIGLVMDQSQGWVNVRHCLLKLAPEALALAGPETPEKNRLGAMQAYLLVDLPEEHQVRLAREISEKRLNVAGARRLVSTEVRDKKIPLRNKNNSRLRMIEDQLKLDRFLERADDYMENLLTKDNEQLRLVLKGLNVHNIADLRDKARELSRKFALLSDSLNGIVSQVVNGKNGHGSKLNGNGRHSHGQFVEVGGKTVDTTRF